jgi:endonuclease/exonuclease/phosphatase (EEP) superfamily protein YafD
MSISFVVDGHGKGGGLALYWEDSIKITILSYGMHHIDTLIWHGEHHAAWGGTFVYGEARTHERHRMWELIRRIKPCPKAPWMMIGDFNEVAWSFEHFLIGKGQLNKC